MVTKVTRDVLDLDIREIIDGIKITGNCGADFSMDGVPIGLGIPCDGTFVNLGATNTTTTNLTVVGVMDVTAATVDGIVGEIPVGGVIMFNAAFATIPSNFQLCDGTNGTPNMTDQFVYGTNTEGELLDTGGSADAVVVDHDHSMGNSGSHTHPIKTNEENSKSGPRIAGMSRASFNFGGVTDGGGNHSHVINNTGVAGTDLNIPPYIKLAFIQRMS